MDILKNFGVEPVLLLAQIVNFLIVFFLLQKYAFKPILKLLKERKETIQEGLKDAEKSRIALEKATEEEKKILKAAQLDGQKLIADAKKQAETMTKEMEIKAKESVEKMLKEAKAQIAMESKEMEKRVAVSTAKLAVQIVEEAMTKYEIFTQKEQEQALEKLSSSLKK